jgi:hypothetical protein
LSRRRSAPITPDGDRTARLRKQTGGFADPGILLCMGLFSRFLGATGRGTSRRFRGLRAATTAASLDPGAGCPFAAAKIPFGNPALTMISVWLGGVKTR